MISLNGRAVKRGRMVNQTSSQFARAHDTDDFEVIRCRASRSRRSATRIHWICLSNNSVDLVTKTAGLIDISIGWSVSGCGIGTEWL